MENSSALFIKKVLVMDLVAPSEEGTFLFSDADKLVLGFLREHLKGPIASMGLANFSRGKRGSFRTAKFKPRELWGVRYLIEKVSDQRMVVAISALVIITGKPNVRVTRVFEVAQGADGEWESRQLSYESKRDEFALTLWELSQLTAHWIEVEAHTKLYPGGAPGQNG